MAMTRPYSGVTHRPAVLAFDPEGHPILIVAGRALGLFAGLRLPRRPLPESDARESDERLEG
jgi:hypothetical protein